MIKKMHTEETEVIKLLLRPNGANIRELHEIGFKQPAMNAAHMAERMGYEVIVNKVAGELTRYIAKRRVSKPKKEDKNKRKKA